jgi:hypothetical protein
MSQAKRDPAPAVVFYHRAQQEKAMTELTQERLKELLHYDPETGVFTRVSSPSRCVKSGDIAGYGSTSGYRRMYTNGRHYPLHQLAWLYMYGSMPEGFIDHINRVRQDNRIVNLRVVTPKQNCENAGKKASNKSGHKGVSWRKREGKWCAQIMHNWKKYWLGAFDTVQEAKEAYKNAAARLHTHNSEV